MPLYSLKAMFDKPLMSNLCDLFSMLMYNVTLYALKKWNTKSGRVGNE